ncbi:hypothetical protein VTK26DRAFT_1016 [Humicola hyalothermophila]
MDRAEHRATGAELAKTRRVRGVRRLGACNSIRKPEGGPRIRCRRLMITGGVQTPQRRVIRRLGRPDALKLSEPPDLPVQRRGAPDCITPLQRWNRGKQTAVYASNSCVEVKAIEIRTSQRQNGRGGPLILSLYRSSLLIDRLGTRAPPPQVERPRVGELTQVGGTGGPCTTLAPEANDSLHFVRLVIDGPCSRDETWQHGDELFLLLPRAKHAGSLRDGYVGIMFGHSLHGCT